MSTIERRTLQVSLRAAGDSKFQIYGTAASYGVLSQPIGGQFREMISPTAFRSTLNSDLDVKCLLNHDMNHILGRRQNKTLVLTDTRSGLGFVCQLDPENQEHRNVYASVKRGDIDACSFAFVCRPGGDEWSEARDEKGKPYTRRVLNDVDLLDVSVVASPAYLGATSVQARSEKRSAFVADYQPQGHLWTPSFSAMSRRELRQLDAYHQRMAREIGFQVAADQIGEFGCIEVRVGPRPQDVRFIPCTAEQRDKMNRAKADEQALQIASDEIDEGIPAEIRHRLLREKLAAMRESGEANLASDDLLAWECEHGADFWSEDEHNILNGALREAIDSGDTAWAAVLGRLLAEEMVVDPEEQALLGDRFAACTDEGKQALARCLWKGCRFSFGETFPTART